MRKSSLNDECVLLSQCSPKTFYVVAVLETVREYRLVQPARQRPEVAKKNVSMPSFVYSLNRLDK